MELGRSGRVTPNARLRLGMTQSFADPRSASQARVYQHPGIELGFSGERRPVLYVGGQSAKQIRERLALTDSTNNTVWIVLGVALAVVGVIVITNLDGLSSDEDN